MDWTPGRQKITVTGDTLGYQFNRMSNGKRTFYRIVRNQEQADDKRYGEVTIKGRIVRVEHFWGRIWDGIKIVGYVD